MAAKNKLVIKHPNAVGSIRKRINANAISIGVQDDQEKKKERDGGTSSATVAEVLFWNEFGTDKIPERPTLRPTFAKERDKYTRIMETIAARAMEDPRYDIRQAMGRLGEVAQQDVQGAIVALRDPPNAPSTIEAKGSDNPLVDTGQMVSSVRWAYAEPVKRSLLSRFVDLFRR